MQMISLSENPWPPLASGTKKMTKMNGDLLQAVDREVGVSWDFSSAMS